VDTLVVLLLVLGLVIAIAAVLVVREAIRLASAPPPVVFALDEAYEWVVERLPDMVAATLTPADVLRILRYQVDLFDRSGVTGNGTNGSTAHSASIVGTAELVDEIVRRSEADDDPFIPEQVYPVVEILLEYLAATGAVSAPADPERPDPT